jgi:hypothetical protein
MIGPVPKYPIGKAGLLRSCAPIAAQLLALLSQDRCIS